MRRDKTITWRTFLEPTGHADSFVAVAIDAPTHWDYRSVNMTIADCNRRIDLGFRLNDKGGRQIALKKVERLQHALDMVREAIEKAPAEHVAAKAEEAERVKAEKAKAKKDATPQATA